VRRDGSSSSTSWQNQGSGDFLSAYAGNAQLNRSAGVDIPGLEGTRDALVAPNSPNLVSLGRLVIDEGYQVAGQRDTGLVLVGPNGERTEVEQGGRPRCFTKRAWFLASGDKPRNINHLDRGMRLLWYCPGLRYKGEAECRVWRKELDLPLRSYYPRAGGLGVVTGSHWILSPDRRWGLPRTLGWVGVEEVGTIYAITLEGEIPGDKEPVGVRLHSGFGWFWAEAHRPTMARTLGDDPTWTELGPPVPRRTGSARVRTRSLSGHFGPPSPSPDRLNGLVVAVGVQQEDGSPADWAILPQPQSGSRVGPGRTVAKSEGIGRPRWKKRNASADEDGDAIVTTTDAALSGMA
jgi:hypothetical protein